ncbi:MAG: hypothetical protein WAP74_03915 [Patescibacteria group bacterium]
MSRFHIRGRLKRILLNRRTQAVRHHVRMAIRNLTHRPNWWQDIRAVRRVYSNYGQLM